MKSIEKNQKKVKGHKHVFVAENGQIRNEMFMVCECGEKKRLGNLILETIANSRLSKRELELLQVVTRQ